MSDKTLDKLISTLKTEAIEAADKEAAKIVESAKAEADRIIRDAESKRDELLESASKDAEATREKGAMALQQAARDLHVRLSAELMEVLSKVLHAEVAAAFTAERIEKAVEAVIKNIGGNVDVTLPEKMKDEVAKDVMKRLQEMKGVDAVTKDAALLSGFSIAKTQEGWSYRITPEDVSGYLAAQLSPRWLALLKNEKSA